MAAVHHDEAAVFEASESSMWTCHRISDAAPIFMGVRIECHNPVFVERVKVARGHLPRVLVHKVVVSAASALPTNTRSQTPTPFLRCG